MQSVKSLITSMGNVFGMQASMVRNVLRQQGMDIEPTIHYCPETRDKNAVIMGLRLIFPDKKSADYFMACVLRAIGGER